MVTAEHPLAIITRMHTLTSRLTELPIGLVESPIGPVLEGPRSLDLAGQAAAVAAAAVLGLDGADLEVRAGGVVNLLVRVRDVRLADKVAGRLAAAAVEDLGYFDAHLECLGYLSEWVLEVFELFN